MVFLLSSNSSKPVARAEPDLRNEKIGLKIREAEKSKVPYMLVVGDRESQAGTVSVRKRNGKSLGTMSVLEVVNLIRHDVPSSMVPGGSSLSE